MSTPVGHFLAGTLDRTGTTGTADPLRRRMAACGIRESDLEESFIHSGGHGGQNVNKTATCVLLVHRPTGIQVKCQTTRQQGLNRLMARRILTEKIELKHRQAVDSARAQLAKLRRQKNARSQSTKERILAQKAHQTRKKQTRRRVEW